MIKYFRCINGFKHINDKTGQKFIETYIVHSSLTEKIHEDQQQFRHHGHHQHTEVVLTIFCAESG